MRAFLLHLAIFAVLQLFQHLGPDDEKYASSRPLHKKKRNSSTKEESKAKQRKGKERKEAKMRQ